jgi:hypothetical protein
VILKLYKSNQTVVLMALPLIMMCFWGHGFFIKHTELIDYSQSSDLFKYLVIDNWLLNKLVAFAIILISGILLNNVINTNEIFERITYLPALLYVIVLSSIAPLHQMHPLIVSNLFWILAYRRLLNVYNQLPCKSEIFDASLLVMLGSLFYFPTSLVLLLLPWMTLIIFRPFDIKEYLMPVLALALLSLYLVVYHIFNPEFIADLSLFSVYQGFDIVANPCLYALYAMLIVVLYLSGYFLVKKSNTSSIRFRKITSQIFSFLMVALIGMLYEKFLNNNDAFLLLGSVPISVVCSFYFFYNKRLKLSGVLFYGSIILLIVNIYV